MNNLFDDEIILFTNKKSDVSALKQGHLSFFILSPEKATLFVEPTLFLYEEYIRNGKTPSPNTWASAAGALKSWFEFLQVIERPWQEASRCDRIDYCDAYLSAVSPRTGEVYSSGTVRGRMIVIREFYEFVFRKGWYHGDIANITKYEEVAGSNLSIDDDALIHTRRGAAFKRTDKDLPKVRNSSKIHPFQISELRTLLNHMGPRASDRGDDVRPSRDRLFADIGWVVGLRLDEMQQLTTLKFLNMHPDPSQPLLSHALVIKGKGGKIRTVAVPGWLVVDAIAYITGERAEALKKGKISSRSASTALFLSGLEGNFPGIPISHRRLQQIVEEACFTLGLVDSVECTDPNTGEIYIKKSARYSVHDLRHTYAVVTYHIELKLGNTAPWKKIQAQLGHAHLSTTIDTYLRHVEIFGQNQRMLDVRKLIGI